MADDNSPDFVIPARPEVVIKLAKLIKQEDPDLDAISQLLKTDVSLYSNVLATINTPLFGLRERVTSVRNAVGLLGVSRLFSIVRMAALRHSLNGIGRLDRFWESATEVAIICALLSQRLDFLSKDDAYTLGMMHNCGVPLMMAHFEDYKGFFESRRGTDLPDLHQQERARYKVDHFAVSSQIARVWRLPEPICEAIHLQPYSSEVLRNGEFSDQQRNVLCLLLLAKEMSSKLRALWGVQEGERPIVELTPVFEHLAICDLDYADLCEEILGQLELDDSGLVPN